MSSDNEVKPEKTLAPASGERRAIGGYYPQYRIAAFLTLGALRKESLEWIRLADPKAGRVDDFQVGTRGRVDAFQMKWSRYGGPITFRELTDKDGLIGQLGDGWKRLRDLYPKARVVVHLITNQTPSVNDRVTVTGRHTAAFIEEVWRQAKRMSDLTSWNPSEAWVSAWQEFIASSTLQPMAFAEFVKDCELEFGYRLPAPEDRIADEDQILAEDLRRMTENLFAAVADPAQIVQITRDELLSRLGWRIVWNLEAAMNFQWMSHSTSRLPKLSMNSEGHLEVLKVDISEFSEAQDQGNRRSLLSAFALVPNE